MDYSFEHEAYLKGYTAVCGIDEAGRGPLAGRAYDNMQKACDYVLIDGNRMPPMPVPGETIVKGDAKSPSIAAASILAKVSRDRVMLEYAKQYPGYHFEKHKGYGTKVHVEALHEFGPCPIHRKTFLKKTLG